MVVNPLGVAGNRLRLSLGALQSHFVQAMLSSDNNHLMIPYIEPQGVSTVEERLQVYRKSALWGVIEAVKRTYPLVMKCLGQTCFEGVVARYLRDRNDHHTDLDTLCLSFAEALAPIPALSERAYLVDLALVEAAWERGVSAPCIEPKSWQDLEAIAEIDRGRVRLAWIPSFSWVPSEYPLFELWQYCRQDDEPHDDFNLDQVGSAVMIWRSKQAMQIRKMSSLETSILSQWDTSMPLSAMMSIPNASNDTKWVEKLSHCLVTWFNLGLVGSIEIPGGNDD